MAVAFGNSTSAKGNNVSSVTFSHTPTTGSNTALLVGVVDNASSENISGATFNSVTMAESTRKTAAGHNAIMYQLANPNTGAHNVVVTWATNRIQSIIAASFTDVDQTTPVSATGGGTSGSQGSPRSDNITVLSGGMAYDTFGLATAGTAITASGSQTDTANSQDDGVHDTHASYLLDATAMAWTWSGGSLGLAHVVAALKPASSDNSGDGPFTAPTIAPKAFVTSKSGQQVYGDLTHVQAAFTNSMSDGYEPSQPRLFLAPRIPLPIAQTTHVEATFTNSMTEGSVPTQPRLFTIRNKVPVPVAGHITEVQAAFTNSMADGYEPTSPRLFTAPRIPLPLFPITNNQAPFTNSMSDGYEPSRPVLFVTRPHTSINPIDVSVITTFGSLTLSSPPKTRTTQHQTRTGPLVNDQAAFTSSMVAGYGPLQPRLFTAPRIPLPFIVHVDAMFNVDVDVPLQPRLFLGPRIPLPLFPITNDQAVFTSSMSDGYGPSRSRLFTSPRIPLPTLIYIEALFNVDVNVSTRPRLFTAPRIPLPLFPIVNDQAAFTTSMVEGNVPSRPRLFLGPRLFITLEQNTHVAATFTNSMSDGYEPSRPRLFLAPRFFTPISQETHVQAAFTTSMVEGSMPSRSKAQLGPRIPLPVAGHLTHVEASFTTSMTEGNVPSRPRLWTAPRLPMPLFPITNDQAAFTTSMVEGSVPSRGRVWIAPRIPLPFFINIPPLFSIEMTVPYQPRLFRAPRIPLPFVIQPDPEVMVLMTVPSIKPRLPVFPTRWMEADYEAAHTPWVVEVVPDPVPVTYVVAEVYNVTRTEVTLNTDPVVISESLVDPHFPYPFITSRRRGGGGNGGSVV